MLTGLPFLQPSASLLHKRRYADILYTLGGNSNMRQARTYYSRAVDLTQGQSARGLFGILASSAAITDKVCALLCPNKDLSALVLELECADVCTLSWRTCEGVRRGLDLLFECTQRCCGVATSTGKKRGPCCFHNLS